MAKMKAALGIIQLWFTLLASSFFKALGNVNVKHFNIHEKHRGSHKMLMFAKADATDIQFDNSCNVHLKQCLRTLLWCDL